MLKEFLIKIPMLQFLYRVLVKFYKINILNLTNHLLEKLNIIINQFKIQYNEKKIEDTGSLYDQALNLAFNNSTLLAKEKYKLAVIDDSNYLKNTKSDYLPKYIQIETVRSCNAACIMCPISTSPTINQNMPDKIFDKILSEIKHNDNYYPAIGLFGLNEPLMDKKLFKRIKTLKDAGITYIQIQTNGSLLTEEKCYKLIESGISEIGFSIESVNKEVFEKIRINLTLEGVLNGMNTFIKIRNKIKPKLAISLAYTYDEKNINEYAEFRKYWETKLSPGIDRILLQPIHSFNKFRLYSEVDSDLPCY